MEILTKEERLAKYIIDHPDSRIAKDISTIKKERIFKVKQAAKKADKTTQKYEKWDEIIKMRRDDKLTLEQIAARLKPKITRERVRQILLQITAELGIEFPNKYNHPDNISTDCLVCGAEIVLRYACQFRGHGKHRCLEHKYVRKYLSKEDAKIAQLEHSKWRYHNDPKFRAACIKASRKWHEKVKNTPEFKAKEKAYQKIWRKKRYNK